MSFESRLRAAHKELEVAGIWRLNYNPPLMHILRKAGLKIPPPHYWSFGTSFFFASVWYSAFWGVSMWFLVWRSQNMSPVFAAFSSLLAGILFGLLMATYYWRGFRKYHLSKWEDL